MAKNITKIYLLDVPLENDYKNTLYFTDLAGQQAYFQSKVVKSYTDFSYQRKDNIIRIPEEYDAIYNVNYVMYQNTAYSNKWFYAFITDLKYVNDGMTEATIETDVIQTWLFDYNVKSSFVEREHVSNDAVGINTVPEGLETGEYIQTTTPTKINNYNTGTYICIGVSELFSELSGHESAFGNKVYNGVYSALYYMVCIDGSSANNILRIYDKKGKKDAVYSVFLIPKEFIFNITSTVTVIVGTSEGIPFSFYPMPIVAGQVNLLRDANLNEIPYRDVTRNTTLSGYVPRNNKLFTGEFNYMVLTNNGGSNATLFYEDFYNLTPRFKVFGSVTPGCSVKCVPVNYKLNSSANDIDNNFNYGVNGTKLPICSWTSDSYTNWLTQNAVNNPIQLASGLGAIAMGGIALASGVGATVGVGAIVGGVTAVAGSLANFYEHSLVPDQANGNINSGDVTYSTGNAVFTVYQMCIKPEYSAIIDGYFDMFGYKVNSVKVPNKAHRSRWWYTKCIDVSIDGNIPDNDIQKIKNCYNNGIRFWRNASEIENYSLSNGISITP